jgi:hypothetical protein
MKLSVAFLIAMFSVPSFAADLKVKIEGQLADSLALLQSLNENGKEFDLQFKLVETDFDYRIAAYSESFKAYGIVMSNGAANASAAVLTRDCKVLFIVSRNGRGTSRGALNAVSKEIDKRLAAYLKAMGP